MIIRMVVIVFALTLAAACNIEQPIRTYCDSEVYYTLVKQEVGFRLVLEVGPPVRGFQGYSCARNGEISLSQDVSSLVEADELINEYRQKYVEKVATRKAEREQAQAQAGTPTKP